MKNKKMILGIAIIVVIGFSMIACNKSGGSSSGGGGKSLNSAEELKDYLDKQPANSPDKPIKVSMAINDPMLKNVADVIKSAGKYVSLNITGDALKTIPSKAFYECETLIGITIPESVTDIGMASFSRTRLASVTIRNGVTSIGDSAFYGCTFTSVTIPASVETIRPEAFRSNSNLTSVTFQGDIIRFLSHRDYDSDPFEGDLSEKFNTGGPGTYKITTADPYYPVWTKQ
jgi:hypothetical protein